jgi:hypothetical protein
MEEENSETSMDAEIEELLREALPQGLVTNFVLIAEVVSDSQQELVLSISDSMTPWLAHGMLETAMDMMRSGEYQFPITEENNGQEY